MGEDEFDVGAAGRCVAHDQAHDGAGRIRNIFERLRSHTFYKIRAACGLDRVRIDNRLAPVQFIENGSQGFVAQPFVAVAGQHGDAVRFERVEGVFDFPQTAFDVGHGQRREQAEATLIAGAK